MSAVKGTLAAEATLPVIEKFSDLGSGDWRYNSDSDRETLRYTESIIQPTPESLQVLGAKRSRTK